VRARAALLACDLVGVLAVVADIAIYIGETRPEVLAGV